MKNQRKFFIVSLIFLCLLVSLSAVSADDMDTIADGEVSGDVDVAVTNPWTTSGELSYEIPEDVKDVDILQKEADYYQLTPAEWLAKYKYAMPDDIMDIY